MQIIYMDGQKLPVNNFVWMKDISQFNEDFIKNYNEENNERYFLKLVVKYHERLHDLHNDLPFLPEGRPIEKFEKLVANLHDETEYVTSIKSLKQALDDGLVF